MKDTITIKDDVSIVLCGEAGRGILTVENLLVNAFKLSEYNVYAMKEYMSRIRGGTNSTEIRVSSNRVAAFVNRIDILIPLNKGAIEHLINRVSEDTIILAEKDFLASDFPMDKYNVIDVDLAGIAEKIGNKIYSTTVGAGIVLRLLCVDWGGIEPFLKQFFKGKEEEVVNKNIEAAKKGFEIGDELVNSKKIQISIQKNPDAKNDMLINGIESIALGAFAGGCNFYTAYPMTPSTGILVYLSKHSKEFSIITEQAEDEISAINMAMGAWYAGGRGMVGTAGGGFALMVEGVSLAGMLESPLVVFVGQRPAPATGLPTRTEQGDLNFVLYSGHGEFPRAIFTPGTIEDGFYLTQRAFNLADKYQVPVFIISDQYHADTYYNRPPLDVSNIQNEQYIVETDKDYKRYAFTESGVSPRGIPANGEGVVDLDSDEHYEDGHITEDYDVRTKMVDKRLKKYEGLVAECIPPELIGPEDYKKLIVCWGSNRNIVDEAIKVSGKNDVAALHFKQVHPMHPDTANYLKKAEKRIILENNATCQFGNLVKLNTGFDFDEKILKYNGLPFYIEEVVDRINKF